MTAGPGWKPAEVLRLAATVDQYSPHVLAHAIVDAARERELEPSVATDVSEEAGRGAHGVVEGRRVTVGRLEPGTPVPDWARAAENRALLDGPPSPGSPSTASRWGPSCCVIHCATTRRGPCDGCVRRAWSGS
ncbi:hypothetical protein ACR6C2_43330 [Streptomyces sp. INA 01156]